jgi:hypothetical protein
LFLYNENNRFMKGTPMLPPKYAPLPLLLLAAVFDAHAQSNKIQAQYWVDLATSSMTIPGMPEEGTPSGGGLLGGLMGNAIGNRMGAAMGVSQGKTMNTELWVRARPAGVEASHAIPAALNMGEALPLLPIRPVQTRDSTPSREQSDSKPEQPKGRILLYWGCGEQVHKGQPKILDFASQNYGEFAQFFSSHGRQSKGTQGKPGDSVWPNERDSKPVPDNASLQGAHAVTGDGVPATLKFNVDAANDFLPKARLVASGQPQDSVALSWNAMANAQGYFLQAQGGGKGDDGSSDLILWSSSEQPDNGWSLMTYQSPAQVAKLVQQKVVLAPAVSSCAIPTGIFAKSQGAMVNMIAYGPELNVSYPARPQKAPADWQPDWTARVRVKSTGMTMLGMNDESSGWRGASEQAPQENKPELPNPVNILKGLFGR